MVYNAVRNKSIAYVFQYSVWVDYTAAIAVVTGDGFTHETVKHITVKVSFLQECVQWKIILLVYIKTG